MVKQRNKVLAIMLTAIMFVFLFATMTVSAAQTPMQKLRTQICTGQYMCITTQTQLDFTTKQYQIEGGGTCLYTDVVAVATNGNEPVFTGKFENLKRGSKQDILEDVFKIANAMATDTAHGYIVGEDAPTDDTVNSFLELVQNESGMGSQMLAMLLQNTKPDYVTANRIYEPFSGVVGTALGILAILIMAFLALTMALDLAYIAIPAFQLACGGAEGGTGQNGGKSSGLGGFISKEAKSAVQGSDGGQGSGDKKSAIGQYFKHRVGMLVMLGICLLYLVQGQIFAGIGAIIDLLSGFLGF